MPPFIFSLSQELLCSGQGKEILAKLINAQRIPFIAIDEVHCLSSWGSVARTHARTRAQCEQRAWAAHLPFVMALLFFSSSHNFRPSFLQLQFLKATYPQLPLMPLTATATKHVQSDVLSTLGLKPAPSSSTPNPAADSLVMVRQSFNRPNVSYSVQMKECIPTLEGESTTIWTHMKKFIIQCIGGDPENPADAFSAPATAGIAGARFTPAASASSASNVAAGVSSAASPAAPGASSAANPVRGSGIIYCATREACHDIAGELRKLRVTASAYHAGLGLKERKEIQEAWMANKCSTIVATTAFGMGSARDDMGRKGTRRVASLLCGPRSLLTFLVLLFLPIFLCQNRQGRRSLCDSFSVVDVNGRVLPRVWSLRSRRPAVRRAVVLFAGRHAPPAVPLSTRGQRGQGRRVPTVGQHGRAQTGAARGHGELLRGHELQETAAAQLLRRAARRVQSAAHQGQSGKEVLRCVR